jgi:glycosyltransferase involved in cell wall biosynthesis
VLAQTYQDFEVVVVDDGSTDATLSILRSYERRDPRFRILSRPNTGICGALNDGLKLCRGEFVARTDADDVVYPNRLETQVRYLREHPECVAVGARVMKTCSENLPLYESELPVDHAEIERLLLRGDGQAIIQGVTLFRRQAMLEVGGYRDEYRYIEDIDLFLRLARVGRLANLPMSLMTYRQHLGSINHTRRLDQHRRLEKLLQEMHQARGLKMPPLPPLGQPVEQYPATMAMQWAWNALGRGQIVAARRHLWRAVRLRPFSLRTLELAWSVLLNRRGGGRRWFWNSPRSSQ